jgi:hypothetical protein
MFQKEQPVPFMGDMARRARAAAETKEFASQVTAAAVAYDAHLDAKVVQQRKAIVPDSDGAAVWSNLESPGRHSNIGKMAGVHELPGDLWPGVDKGGRGHSYMPHPETIASMLYHHRVSFAELKVKHFAMLKLEKMMLGAAPNTDTYLAIYPIGLRTSFLIIPNLLNIPQLMLGSGTPSSIVGIAMHYSSRASKSRYCSLHTACFALRRGIPAAVLRSNAFTEAQAVAVDAALRLGSFPSTMSKDCRDLLYQVGRDATYRYPSRAKRT